MGELLGRVLPLALGAAISPTVLAVDLLILSSPKRPVGRGVAFLAGVLTVIAGLSVIGLQLSHHTAVRHGGRIDPVTRDIDLVVGVLLLLLALSTVLRMLSDDRTTPPDPDAAPPSGSGRREGLGSAALVGAAMMLTNFSTILLYLPAMHAVARARVDTADKVVAVVLAAAITSLPATIPLVVRLVAPGPSQRWFSSLHAWVARHSRDVAVVIEVVFGLWLLWKAR